LPFGVYTLLAFSSAAALKQLVNTCYWTEQSSGCLIRANLAKSQHCGFRDPNIE